MPNIRIGKTGVPNIVTRGNNFPNVRSRSFQTTRSGEARSLISQGTPIGLLLVLTYSEIIDAAPTWYSDFRPNIRIKTY